ncbi:Shedu immune nuclease family protein [Enterococcus hirae]|uniref:Shedu immune nuclease family protein n=2 Tax=Enterococcus TaxID=1350 RepID=UPI0035D58D87
MTNPLKIVKNEDFLICEYTPFTLNTSFIFDKISQDGSYTLKRTFSISNDEILEKKEEYIKFIVGEKEDCYYHLNNKVLGIEHNIFIHEDMKTNISSFIAHENISIMKKIDNIIDEDLYIGGESGNLPESVFEELIKKFPNKHELYLYSNMRIGVLIQDYLLTKKENHINYENYMSNKHRNTIIKKNKDIVIEKKIAENEYLKYQYIKEKLVKMLENEKFYLEKDWQKEIANILTLIFPMYQLVVDEVMIETDEGKKRPDFVFIDVNGNIDIAEIKKSYNIPIMTKTKYRNNYIASKELTGTLMQIEKYIYHLTRTAKKSEEIIKKKVFNQTQEAVDIYIRNPRGMIILGRSDKLNVEQLRDFEILRRKYKHVADIISYDDLVHRLDSLLKKFENETI